MSDIVEWLSAEEALEERDVEIDGETRSVWFRRVSAGQREQLLRGLKVNHVPGENDGSIEIDLGENEHQGQLLVLFSVCKEDGKPAFRNLETVRKIPHRKFKILLKHAEAVNKDMADDPGED